MPYSRFNYLTTSGLADYIHTMSGVTDHTLAAKFISDAETIVDSYVGKAPKFYSNLTGSLSSAVTSSGTTVSATVFGDRRTNYWACGGHYLTIANIPGSGSHALVGTKRLIVGSTSGSVTLASGFGTNLAAGVEFKLSQESRFPRWCDSDSWGTPELPPDLERAVAWQVEYGILYGSESYGLGDSSVAAGESELVQSRSYSSGYSETRIPGERRGLAAWIAPKARAILRDLIIAIGRVR